MMHYRSTAVLLLLILKLYFVAPVCGNNLPLVKSLTLYNNTFTTNSNLGRLHDGRVLDVGEIGTNTLSVVAEVDNVTTGRLAFFLDETFVRNEWGPIYALNGNSRTRLIPYTPLGSLGVHILSYKLFAPVTNKLVESRSVSFTVINSKAPGPIRHPILVNTITNAETRLPSVIALSEVGTTLSILVNLRDGSNVSYVEFWFDDVFVRAEGNAPLVMNGNVGSKIKPYLPLSTIGTHTIKVKSFSATHEPLGENIYCVQVVQGTSMPITTPTAAPLPIPTAAPMAPVAQVMATVTGELRKWHKITLAYTGPYANETDISINPFMDYKMDVTFTHATTNKTYMIPGYFAADGNSSETSAMAGNQWHCIFVPDEIGTWNYNVAFVQGTNISVGAGGSPTSFHGATGTLSIEASNKSGHDFRGKGRLKYVGDHHLQFAETAEYFIKVGVDSPENFLAYEDFDNTPNHLNYRKSWSPHKQDFQDGDPTWQDGKGKGIIGAINYLSNEGLNAFSFIAMNIDGDDENVFPYVSDAPQHRLRMDVSKLAQWEILFEHADRMGVFLHFKLGEKENNNLLDGGLLGNERKLFYREFIARFGHHLAMCWNLSEEMNLSEEKVKEFADYIKSIDPYGTMITVQFGIDSLQYANFTGYPTIRGSAIQTHPSLVYINTQRWVRASAAAGSKWIVWNDHQNPSKDGLLPDSIDPNHNMIRQSVLWGNIMAGGAGVQYYFGRGYDNSDVTCQDYRSRSFMWQQSRYALEFFHKNKVPFWRMKSDNSLVTAGSTDWALISDDGNWIVIYRRRNSGLGLRLDNLPGRFIVEWYNPLVGGQLQEGNVHTVVGGGNFTVFYGNPPHSNGIDWVVLLIRAADPN